MTKNLHTVVLSTLTKLCKLDYKLYTTFLQHLKHEYFCQFYFHFENFRQIGYEN